ncbi:hypothetical protein EIN_491840 [Entamoeba invadens IP1]|uniref:RING-type domain-containing protein n=1 Tax=Entamoeba invadens IP1 TaxID=370355 RepID=A0A0A1U479_ENTIV|nr:hypothetical protein EIN_491840 [Entamoeba invadens IP1]ELP88975.1 hypothetical protein EIN_491840 [Entamoeba invadens IP1]|eukprot:XP_004255746.1 hypothetical protein EIN_491840 [Entamoeba invadens IP1]
MDPFLCSYCSHEFIDPVTLSCGHTFCLTCIRKIFREDNVCPTCQMPFGRPFVVDEVLKTRMEHYKAQNTISIEEDNTTQLIEEKHPFDLLSLPEYTIIEIMKYDPQVTCLLSRTCKKLYELSNLDDVWMDKVLLINPSYQHKLGVSWKSEFISLYIRRRCYICGGVKNYNAKTIFTTESSISHTNYNRTTGDLDIVDNNKLIIFHPNDVTTTFTFAEHPSLVSRNGNIVFCCINNVVYKYTLDSTLLVQYTPHNKVIALLQSDVDYFVTEHSVIQLSDNGAMKESVFPNSVFSFAALHNKNIILCGLELDQNMIRVLDPDFKILQALVFEQNEPVIVNGWRVQHPAPLLMRENMILCHNSYWIFGDDVIRQFNDVASLLGVFTMNNKTVQVTTNSIKIKETVTHLNFSVHSYFADFENNRLFLIDSSTKVAKIFENGKIVFSMLLGSDSESLISCVFNHFEYKLYVTFTHSIRVFNFGEIN